MGGSSSVPFKDIYITAFIVKDPSQSTKNMQFKAAWKEFVKKYQNRICARDRISLIEIETENMKQILEPYGHRDGMDQLRTIDNVKSSTVFISKKPGNFNEVIYYTGQYSWSYWITYDVINRRRITPIEYKKTETNEDDLQFTKLHKWLNKRGDPGSIIRAVHVTYVYGSDAKFASEWNKFENAHKFEFPNRLHMKQGTPDVKFLKFESNRWRRVGFEHDTQLIIIHIDEKAYVWFNLNKQPLTSEGIYEKIMAFLVCGERPSNPSS